MASPVTALSFQSFDSEAFGIPFYRVVHPSSPALEQDVETLVSSPAVIIDAKLPAEDISNGARLLRLGFRKICVQIEFHHKLGGSLRPPERQQIRPTLNLTSPVISKHARHFTFDRFAQDVQLPTGGHQLLFERWIGNSLASTSYSVAAYDNSFITFIANPKIYKIDLVSILDPGKGIATDLIRSVLIAAKDAKIQRVEVVTECENRPAVKLYLKSGFIPARFYSVFHLVRM